MDHRHKRKGGGWQQRIKQKAAKNPLLGKPKGMTRPPLVEREILFNRFREALGEVQLASFIAHIRKQRGIYACETLDKALAEGKNLLGLVLTAKRMGYCFGFRQFSRDRWLLFFGNYAGPLAGDSGEWIAKFEASGKIAEIRLRRSWIS